MFEILAGPQHKRFLAHAGVLSKSEKFRAVVNGTWKDSAEAKIVLEDWDEETVARLLDWLYTGDYETPYPEKCAETTVATPTDDVDMTSPKTIKPAKKFGSTMAHHSYPLIESDIEVSGTPEPKVAKQRPTGCLAPLITLQNNTQQPQPHPFQAAEFQKWTSASPSSPHAYSYAATLLAHAKLYALANYMLLPNLKNLTLHRLQSTLIFIGDLKSGTAPISGVVSLARYVYANTDGLITEEEPLRNFVSTFISINFSSFDGEEVNGLMNEGGDLVVDVCMKARRITGELKRKVEADEELWLSSTKKYMMKKRRIE